MTAFFQLVPCFLLPPFPTYKQNTAIHQHGRNCSQSYKASICVLSQTIRNCLHSLCMPHVRGTSTLPTGHTRAQPRIQGGKRLPVQGSHTHPLLPWDWHLPCHINEEWSKSLLPWGIWPSTNRRGEQWGSSFIRVSKLQKIKYNPIY